MMPQNDVALHIGVTGLAVTIHGPETWLGPLERAWKAWQTKTKASPWEVHIVPTPSLPTPRAPLFEALPRSHGGTCTLSIAGFQGTITSAQASACLQAHPQATPADVGYFLRVVLALQAFVRGGLLFHAAGIVHRGKGYALFGISGSGKTTAARLSAPDPVLNDDLLLLWPSIAGWEVYATPFGKRRGSVPSVPLHALLRLFKSTDVCLEPLSKARAMGELIANTPVLSGDVIYLPDLIARWEKIVSTVPVRALHFRREPTFWEVIDVELG